MTPPKTTRNLEECTRQVTKMIDLILSDFTAVNSTLTAMLFSSYRRKRKVESVVRKSMSRPNKLGSMMKELSKAAKLIYQLGSITTSSGSYYNVRQLF